MFRTFSFRLWFVVVYYSGTPLFLMPLGIVISVLIKGDVLIIEEFHWYNYVHSIVMSTYYMGWASLRSSVSILIFCLQFNVIML